jgi:hypothetical protein
MPVTDRTSCRPTACASRLFEGWNAKRPDSIRLPERLHELNKCIGPLPLAADFSLGAPCRGFGRRA